MLARALCNLGLCAALAACAPAINTYKPEDAASAAQRQMLIGHWYGEAPLEGGGIRQWIVERRADGFFKVQFHLINADGTVTNQTEVGIWGASAGIYFTKTTGWLDGDRFSRADPTDASYDDAYAIESVTADTFRMRSLAFGDTFTVKRVSETFTIPK